MSAASREVIFVLKALDSDVIGKVILEDIYSKNNVLLTKAGTVLTKSLVERLQKNNIVQVKIRVEMHIT
jgi:hypothetical protein